MSWMGMYGYKQVIVWRLTGRHKLARQLLGVEGLVDGIAGGQGLELVQGDGTGGQLLDLGCELQEPQAGSD